MKTQFYIREVITPRKSFRVGANILKIEKVAGTIADPMHVVIYMNDGVQHEVYDVVDINYGLGEGVE
jgi:hypothetical protein